MNYNAVCFGEKKMDLNPFLVQFCCLNVTWESIIYHDYRPRKSTIIDLFSLFLNAGGFRLG